MRAVCGLLTVLYGVFVVSFSGSASRDRVWYETHYRCRIVVGGFSGVANGIRFHYSSHFV